MGADDSPDDLPEHYNPSVRPDPGPVAQANAYADDQEWWEITETTTPGAYAESSAGGLGCVRQVHQHLSRLHHECLRLISLAKARNSSRLQSFGCLVNPLSFFGNIPSV